MTKRLLSIIVIILSLCLIMSACDEDELPSGDTTPSPVTLNILYWENPAVTVDGFINFCDYVEKKYSYINIELTYEQKHNYDSMQENNLKKGVGSDIVMMRNANSVFSEDYLLELTSQSYVANLKDSAINRFSIDNRLYCVAGLDSVKGILYNKTMFEENGWALPNDFESFFSLCETIENSGIRSIQLPAYTQYERDASTLAFAMVACNYLSQDEGYDFMTRFNEGDASALEWITYLDGYTRMIDADIIDYSEDSRYNVNDCYDALIDGDCAMIMFDSSELPRVGERADDAGLSLGVLPYFGSSESKNYFLSQASFLAGINSSLIHDQDKLNAAHLFMELLSSAEGQQKLAEYDYAVSSYVKGVTITTKILLNDAKAAYQENRLYDVNWGGEAERTFGVELIKLQQGLTTLTEVLLAVDASISETEKSSDSTVLGTVTADMLYTSESVRTGELAVANFVTDLAREKAGTQIAIINAGAIRNSLYEGEVTLGDIADVLKYDNYVCKALIKGSAIIAALENGVSMLPLTEGRFLHFSGIRVVYDTSKEAGSRVVSVTMDSGVDLDPNSYYSVLTTDYLLGSGVDNDGFDILNYFNDSLPVVEGVFDDDVEELGVIIRFYIADILSSKTAAITPVVDGRISFVS